jgi:catechol 2,3-dioxygenase-like lactoylglutathione lyase family enzyme
LVQIHRIELGSSDPEAQAAFWGQTIGLPVEEASDGVAVRLRRSTIAFVPGAAETKPQYHFALNVPGGRAEEALEWLGERVEVLPSDTGEPVIRFEWIGADSLYFHDAGGNVVELMAREEIVEDAGRPFGPDLLLEVSEIGIASEDVLATSDVLREALGAPTYWGGGEGLTAVGDGAGAVLVSPRGRGWIPTDLPAEPAPTRIVADGSPRGRTEIPGGPYVVEALG